MALTAAMVRVPSHGAGISGGDKPSPRPSDPVIPAHAVIISGRM